MFRYEADAFKVIIKNIVCEKKEKKRKKEYSLYSKRLKVNFFHKLNNILDQRFTVFLPLAVTHLQMLSMVWSCLALHFKWLDHEHLTRFISSAIIIL